MSDKYKNLRDFRSLKLTDKIYLLIKDVHKLCDFLPEKEKYNLKDQIIRSSSSIGANLAEGNGQMYIKKDYSFMNNALGSASETLFWLEYAYKMGYISKEKYNELEEKCIEIRKMLYGCMRKIKNDINSKKTA